MALKNSYDIENYKIYLYCDGPKNESDNNKINKIKDIIENNNNLKFAKKLYRSENFGLAKNIILSNKDKWVCKKVVLYTLGGDCYSELKQYDLAINYLKGKNVNKEIFDAKSKFIFDYKVFENKNAGGGFVIKIKDFKKND